MKRPYLGLQNFDLALHGVLTALLSFQLLRLFLQPLFVLLVPLLQLVGHFPHPLQFFADRLTEAV
jgi:hypothetical protein